MKQSSVLQKFFIIDLASLVGKRINSLTVQTTNNNGCQTSTERINSSRIVHVRQWVSDRNQLIDYTHRHHKNIYQSVVMRRCLSCPLFSRCFVIGNCPSSSLVSNANRIIWTIANTNSCSLKNVNRSGQVATFRENLRSIFFDGKTKLIRC